MKYKVPFVLVIICLAVVAGVYGVYSYLSIQKQEPQISHEQPVEEITLQTYKSDKYGFEIQHPSNWQVSADENVPGVHIYKKSDQKPEYLTHHSSFTHVSIYPEGIGTEGLQGKTASTTMKFNEQANQPFDYVLEDGSHFATFSNFKNPPVSWQEWGFIWAGVKVDNEKVICAMEDQTPTEGACDFGYEFVPGVTIRTGTINQADRDTEKAILESFTFIK